MLKIHGLVLLALFAGALSLPAGQAADTPSPHSYDAYAKAQLRRAHEQMARATEVSVYQLYADETDAKLPPGSSGFPIKPYSTQAAIKAERTLRESGLSKLLDAWMELDTQDGYASAMCHYPIYGLRFRDARGAICFETSLCWRCSNYYIEEADGFDWAALPKNHLPHSALKKLLDGLFETPATE